MLGHTVGQHRQGIAQVNHVVQTTSKEIVDAGAYGNLSKTPRNSIARGNKLREINNRPQKDLVVRSPMSDYSELLSNS